MNIHEDTVERYVSALVEIGDPSIGSRPLAKKLDVDDTGVRKFLCKYPEVRKMAADRISMEGSRIITNKQVPECDFFEWSGKLVDLQKMKKKSSISQDFAEIQVLTDKPILVVGMADTHIGSWGTDYELLMRITVELVETAGIYIILLGDLGQYSIKLRSVLEVSDNIVPPELQTGIIASWLDYISPKVLAATWDNHGIMRQEAQIGESPLKNMLGKRFVYHNGIGHIDLKVGEELYKLAVSHKFQGRSYLNPVHSQQRYTRMEGGDREVVMSADTHVPAIGAWFDGPTKKFATNAGTTQLNSGYAKRFFSLFSMPDFPALMFYPTEHRIVPFMSVGDWAAATGAKIPNVEKVLKGLK